MASVLQPVCFTPQAIAKTKALSATAGLTHGSGLIEPYNPDAEQLRYQMQRDLEAEQAGRIKEFEDQKKAYLDKLDRYYHKQIDVVERHQSLDDRYFQILSEATASCLSTRYLDNREKYAYDLLTEPKEDIKIEEEKVVKLEKTVEEIYEKLGEDTNGAIELELQKEENECEDLISINNHRNNDIALRKSRVQQEMLLPNAADPKFQRNTGVFNPVAQDISDDVQIQPEKSIEKHRENTERLNVILKEMENVDGIEKESRKAKKASEDLYESKLQQIHSLLDQVSEIEKYESFVSEYEYVVRNLRADLTDKQYEIHDIIKEKSGGPPPEEVEIIKERINEKERKINEKKVSLQKKRADYEKHLKETIEYSESEKKKSEEVDSILRELNKKATQAISTDDMANRLAEQLHGEKDVPTSSLDSLSKIEELKRNLELLKIEDSSDEDDE